MKPKILVIVDVPGWALERTADNVIARLSGQYDFEKAFNKNAVEKIRAGNFDLLYITYETQFQDAGIAVDIPKNAPSPVSAAISSGTEGERACRRLQSFSLISEQFAALNVPSRILYNIFKPLHPAVFYTPHGVDIHSLNRGQGARTHRRKGSYSSAGQGRLPIIRASAG